LAARFFASFSLSTTTIDASSFWSACFFSFFAFFSFFFPVSLMFPPSLSYPSPLIFFFSFRVPPGVVGRAGMGNSGNGTAIVDNPEIPVSWLLPRIEGSTNCTAPFLLAVN